MFELARDLNFEFDQSTSSAQSHDFSHGGVHSTCLAGHTYFSRGIEIVIYYLWSYATASRETNIENTATARLHILHELCI